MENSPSTAETSVSINMKTEEGISDLFTEINEDRIQSWYKILTENPQPFNNFNIDDCTILNTDAKLNQAKIIQNDIDRTRVRERRVMPSFQDYTSLFLSYYCKENKIEYKQGLNEIVGPFIWLKYKVTISFAKWYKLFVCFVDKFLTNYYWEDEFYSLQSSLSLVGVLLRYHCPEIFSIFDYIMVTPEMYATSWILTIFGNKCTLDVVYHLWDKLIIFNDNLFLHFWIVAFVIRNKDSIVNTDYAQVPSVLSQMSMKTIDEVDGLICYALELSEKTPNSFRLLANKLEIFYPRSTRLKEWNKRYDPETLLAMPIFPSDILSITYKDYFGCVDEVCATFNKKNQRPKKNTQAMNAVDNNNPCFFCNNKDLINSNISYILIDLRIVDRAKQNWHNDNLLPGYLPLSVFIDEKELMSEDFPDNWLERFKKDKNKYHFMWITSQTDYFREFEDKYYIESEGNHHQLNPFHTKHYGLITKINKGLNTEMVDKTIKKEKNSDLSLRIKEFDNLKKAIQWLLNENFCYVSYIYGGFNELHNFSIKYSLNLLGHGGDCYWCEKWKPKKGWMTSFKKMFNGNIFRKKSNKNENIKDDTIFKVNNVLQDDDDKEAEEEGEGVTNTKKVKKGSFRNDNKDETISNNKIPTPTNPEFIWHDKVFTNPKLEWNINEMAKWISNPNLVQYTCLYRSDWDCVSVINNNINVKEEETHEEIKESSVMLFWSKKNIFIYQEIKEENLYLNYILTRNIPIDCITSIIQKNQAGNILSINYHENDTDCYNATVDFVSETDGNDFKMKIKKIRQVRAWRHRRKK